MRRQVLTALLAIWFGQQLALGQSGIELVDPAGEVDMPKTDCSMSSLLSMRDMSIDADLGAVAPAAAYSVSQSQAVCEIRLTGAPGGVVTAVSAAGEVATASIPLPSAGPQLVKSVSISCTGGSSAPILVGGPNITVFSDQFTGRAHLLLRRIDKGKTSDLSLSLSRCLCRCGL